MPEKEVKKIDPSGDGPTEKAKSMSSEVYHEGQKKSRKKRDVEARNWTFVLYPPEIEPSTPSNWRDCLDALGCPWFESPLHDKDVYEDDDVNEVEQSDSEPKYKKAHKHIILQFAGKRRYSKVSMITASINGTIPHAIESLPGLVQYLAHVNNPEKAQYNPDDIIGHNGADVAKYLAMGRNTDEVVAKMITYVRQEFITSYGCFLDEAVCNHSDDWLPILVKRTAVVRIVELAIKSNQDEVRGTAVPSPSKPNITVVEGYGRSAGE